MHPNHNSAQTYQQQIATALAALNPVLPSQFMQIQAQQCTISTNDDAKKLAEQGLTTALCTAQTQAQGRGQSGRSWASPQGNLYLSILWTLHQPIDGRLALEVALAIVGIPLWQNIANLRVKWPNDLHVLQADGLSAKWGGILIEPINSHQVVIGVGLNLITPSNLIQNDVDFVQPISSITDFLMPPNTRQAVPTTVELVAYTAQAIIDACNQFDNDCPQLVQRFSARDTLSERAISVLQPTANLQGIAQGILPDGALALACNGTITPVYSGRIILKK